MLDVRISPTALDALESLPPDVQDRVKTKLLEEIAHAEDPGRYIQELRGQPHGRIRVGDYRVIAQLDRDANQLRIHDVGHRRDIYD